MANVNPLVEVLRQVVEGQDFSTPAGLLRSIRPEIAVAIPEGAPYSIATNVQHARIWQDYWLAGVRGERRPKIVMGQDFPTVGASEWPEVRRSFVLGLDEAYALAQGQVGEREAKMLLQIAVHGAYHLGQVQLLKRLLKSGQA